MTHKLTVTYSQFKYNQTYQIDNLHDGMQQHG
jgi:hypothetical protein